MLGTVWKCCPPFCYLKFRSPFIVAIMITELTGDHFGLQRGASLKRNRFNELIKIKHLVISDVCMYLYCQTQSKQIPSTIKDFKVYRVFLYRYVREETGKTAGLVDSGRWTMPMNYGHATFLSRFMVTQKCLKM